MTFEEDKKPLIDLITWYRDKWHKGDFGHTEMIEKIKETDDPKLLELYWKITDGWLDY